MRALDFISRIAGDARYFQIAFLGVFLIYGVNSLHWEFKPLIILSITGTAILTQYIFCRIYNKPLNAILSAMITAMGLSILMKTQFWYIAVLATFLAISSKYLLRIKGKHIFNPANFGLVATIYLTRMAWVSPGQWGSNLVLLYFLAAAGSMLLLKVGRVDTGLVFLGTYAFCQVAYSNLYLGWPLDYTLHKLSNGALLLYSFFMITDPSTTPNNQYARVMWSICIAVLAFYWAELKYMNGTPIKALFIVSLCTPLIDYVCKGQTFSWKYSLKF